MTLRVQDLLAVSMRSLAGIVAVATVLLVVDSSNAVPALLLLFSACMFAYRLDFTNLWVAFALPWLVILAYGVLDISDYSRAVSRETILSITLVLAIGLVLLPGKGIGHARTELPKVKVNIGLFYLVLTGYLMFCLLNVALAGYIPLVQGVQTGDTGYMDFGVKGLYGVFNAFANAFGLTCFYLWIADPTRRIYKLTYFLIMGVFLLFVTRQNLISLLVESFILYCMLVRKISSTRIVVLAVLALTGFGLVGDFRIGSDIATLAAVREDFLWLPRAFVWLFAYCYFNLLNLDNVVASSIQPALDGSSLASLLPSFLRPELGNSSDFLEVSNFGVSSFMSPLVHDIGIAGAVVVFALLCLSVHWYIGLRKRRDGFVGDTGYAVLYFCFLFSFFTNFWFYLPVIFQLAFLPLFRVLLFRRASASELTDK